MVRLLIILLALAACQKNTPKKLADNFRETALNNQELSYAFYDLETKQLVAQKNLTKKLTPASAFKIMTAYAALEILGYQQRFNTVLYYKGRLKNNVLRGDLIISGRGDPSLDYTDLYNIALQIRALGIEKITGNILYHDRFFPSASQINRMQPTATYNPGYAALTLRRSSFAVEYDEEDKKLNVIPAAKHLQVQRSKYNRGAKYRGHGRWLIGKNQERLRLPIRNNALYVTTLFKSLLEKSGISITGKIYELQNLSGVNELLTYEGRQLLDIIRDNLQFSQNLVSELLLLHIASRLECEVTSLSSSAACLKDWYQDEFPELDWTNLEWYNGSGLAVNTKLTAEHIITVLNAFQRKNYGKHYPQTLLPASGVSGTLHNRFKEIPLQIWAKTGTMHFVSALAGYMIAEGKNYSFVILANDLENRAALDKAEERGRSRDFRELVSYGNDWREEIFTWQDELLLEQLDL